MENSGFLVPRMQLLSKPGWGWRSGNQTDWKTEGSAGRAGATKVPGKQVESSSLSGWRNVPAPVSFPPGP